MYHIAICDDDIIFIKYMKRMLLSTDLSKEDITFHEYTSGEAFIDALTQITTIDLLILDIQMPGMNGNQTAKKFRELFPFSILVFCSGVYQPTVESFETTPFRYLLKEYTDSKMLEELTVIIHELSNKKIEPYIIGTWHHNTIKLMPSEITYISIARNYSQIHIDPKIAKYPFEQKIVCHEKLSKLYEILKDYDFEYAHNSYLVNLHFVKRHSAKVLELFDGTTLSISRSKEKTFRLAFTKYMAKKYK